MTMFATRVWGFDPSNWPVITFGLEGNRDRLLLDSKPGDRVVFVGTQGEPTSPAEWGRLLGMAEIGRLAIDTTDVVAESARSPHDFDAEGRFRWPKAILMLKAWRFTPQPMLVDVLERQLSYGATPRAVLLSAEDETAVLKLSAVEVGLPDTAALAKARLLDRALHTPTTGPTPSSWVGETGRDVNRTAHTYAVRFADSDIWKIGHAVDVNARVNQLNLHIPSEIIPKAWRAIYTQRWPDEIAAHAMEQRVLKALGPLRTEGERVRCSEDQLRSEWLRAIGV